MTTRIEQLRAINIVGNAYGDRKLLRLAHEIATDVAAPLLERYESLAHMDRAMGMDPLNLDDGDACSLALAEYLGYL